MITAQRLTDLGITHGFFTREGGVSSGPYAGLNVGLGSSDKTETVEQNRAIAVEMLGLPPKNLITPFQVHSPRVLTVTHADLNAEREEADAVVTATPNLAIGIVTADCGPVLFADAESKVVGAAHSGWKGAIGGVLENTISAMEMLGARKENIVAVLGPTISQEAYEVGPEFKARFVEEQADYAAYFIPSEKAGHFYFDLPSFIIMRLQKTGIKYAENLQLCTYQDEDLFYSYRRMTHRGEADYGRLLSAIALT